MCQSESNPVGIQFFDLMLFGAAITPVGKWLPAADIDSFTGTLIRRVSFKKIQLPTVPTFKKKQK